MNSTGIFSRRAIALSMAIITITVLAILAAVVLSLAVNQRRLAGPPVHGRTRAFFRAQAGLVDAKETIRMKSCPACRCPPAPATCCGTCESTCAAFATNCPYEADSTTASYTLDVEGDGIQDTTVTISARNAATGLRTITSNGAE